MKPLLSNVCDVRLRNDLCCFAIRGFLGSVIADCAGVVVYGGPAWRTANILAAAVPAHLTRWG